jgi:hypothetical protein
MATKKPVSFAQREWDRVWKDLVTTNGRIDKAKLMVELADFSILMEEACKVYCHVTGGRVLTVEAMAEDVIHAATEADNDALKEILADEKAKWQAEYDNESIVCDVVDAEPSEFCYVALCGKTLTFEGRHIRVTTTDGTFTAAFSSETDQLFLDEARPLPADWVDTAKEAAKSLLSKES